VTGGLIDYKKICKFLQLVRAALKLDGAIDHHFLTTEKVGALGPLAKTYFELSGGINSFDLATVLAWDLYSYS